MFLCPSYNTSYLESKKVLVLQITDSSSHTLYSKEDATKGKFAFTTEDYDMFEVCFESKSPMGKCIKSDGFAFNIMTCSMRNKILDDCFIDVETHLK